MNAHLVSVAQQPPRESSIRYMEHAPYAPHETARGHILIVDDENGPRQALRMLLKDRHELHLAFDGQAALDMLAQSPVDLVITDLRMPGMSGIELLHAIRERFPDVEVIILTGYGQLDTAMKAVELGAYAYLEKPFNNDTMLDYVNSALSKRYRDLERRKLERLALEANRFETLGRVVCGMIHDLGSPLSVVGSHVELMMIDPQLTDYMNRLETMHGQIRHCTDIIRSTMNFLRHKERQRVLVNLNEIVEGCVEISAPILRKQAIKIERKLDENLVDFRGDLVLIRQTVLNLLTNACHAMEGQEAPPCICFSTWMEGETACLSVRDTGPGIPAQDRERVFHTFYTTKESTGTGLGLAVVQNAMQQHSGSVELATPVEDNRGAKFILRFPLDAEGGETRG